MAQEPEKPVTYPNLVSSSPGVVLNSTSTSVDLVVPQVESRRLRAIPAGASNGVELVLRDLVAEEPPFSLLDVYIERKGAPATRQYVGTINWFGAFGHHGMRMASDQSYDFEITQQLKALDLSPSSPNLTVTLEASDGRVPTAHAAGTLKAPTPASLNLAAKVHVGAIELRKSK
jgi:hypothetical protein